MPDCEYTLVGAVCCSLYTAMAYLLEAARASSFSIAFLLGWVVDHFQKKW